MHKHRSGPVDLIFPSVPLTNGLPARTLNDGDLVAYDANASPAGLVPVASFTWDTDKATTQAEFATAFRGICVGHSRASSTDARDLIVPVEQDGNFEADVATGTALKIGDYLGPQKDSGNNLKNALEKVADKEHAVCVCMEDMLSTGSRVLVRLVNTLPKK